MMIRPGISELSKCVDSRYTLVTMAAKRARMIGKARMEDYDAFGDDKPVTIASDEIVTGKVGYVRSEAIARAQAWEDEKAANIMSLNNTKMMLQREFIWRKQQKKFRRKLWNKVKKV